MKLKVYFCSFLLFFGLQAGFVSGKENPDTETDIETNILIFGNSACHGFIDYLPKMYEADGMRLNLRCLRSSAAGFVRAIDAVESGRATGEPLPA